MATQLLDHRLDGMPGAGPVNNAVNRDLTVIATLRARDDQHAAPEMADRA
jgi:hypothetical protein